MSKTAWVVQDYTSIRRRGWERFGSFLTLPTKQEEGSRDKEEELYYTVKYHCTLII
jgi:hypothetical protein